MENMEKTIFQGSFLNQTFDQIIRSTNNPLTI